MCCCPNLPLTNSNLILINLSDLSFEAHFGIWVELWLTSQYPKQINCCFFLPLLLCRDLHNNSIMLIMEQDLVNLTELNWL